MATLKRLRSDTEDVASKRACKSAPIDKIMNVVELCEQVLLHLPMRDLLHAMQVCRTFKANIDTSHRLQANLFLAPDLQRSKFATSSTGTLLSGIKAAQHIAAAQAAGEPQTGEFTCCTIHPALERPASDRRRSRESKRQGMVEYAAHRFNHLGHTTDDVAVRPSILSSIENGIKASGLDGMMLAQPPVISAVVYVVFHARDICISGSISNTAGLTFDDVFKAVAKIGEGKQPMSDLSWWIAFDSWVFVVSAEAKAAAERAGELSLEDDPTRWVIKNRKHVLKEGGFEF